MSFSSVRFPSRFSFALVSLCNPILFRRDLPRFLSSVNEKQCLCSRFKREGLERGSGEGVERDDYSTVTLRDGGEISL